MPDSDLPIASPLIVLREEFDDWAILFDPDSGLAFGLNPVGVFVWKRLDGRHTDRAIVEELREVCESLPEEAEEHVREFVRELVERGLVGYEVAGA